MNLFSRNFIVISHIYLTSLCIIKKLLFCYFFTVIYTANVDYSNNATMDFVI